MKKNPPTPPMKVQFKMRLLLKKKEIKRRWRMLLRNKSKVKKNPPTPLMKVKFKMRLLQKEKET